MVPKRSLSEPVTLQAKSVNKRRVWVVSSSLVPHVFVTAFFQLRSLRKHIKNLNYHSDMASAHPVSPAREHYVI